MRSRRLLTATSPSETLFRVLWLAALAWLAAPNVARSAIPVDALVEIDRIGLESTAALLALTPDGSRLLVTGFVVGPGGAVSSSVVSVIDTGTSSVIRTVPLGEGFGFEVAVTPDASRAYVAVSNRSGGVTSAGSNRVEVIDLETLQLAEPVEIVPPGSAVGPIGVAITPDGGRAYVTHRGAGQVLPLNTDPDSPDYHSILPGITTGGFPVGLAVTPDGDRVYVALRSATEVVVIDTSQNVETARIATGLNPSTSHTGVAVVPDGDRAYVTYFGDSRFVVLDTDPESATVNTVLSTVDTESGRSLSKVALSSDGLLVFMASTSTDELLVIDSPPYDVSRDAVLASVAVGDFPFDVAYQHQPQAVAYVTNGLDASVSVVGVSCGLALENAVRRLSRDDFSHPNHQRTLLNKIAALQGQLDDGDSCGASNKLRNDILPKVDGLPGPDDWVTSAPAQDELQGIIEMCLAQALGNGCP